ncbi:glycosyltransferase [Mucilaginibacter lacusdianchii]|uniref:glycosyltransferase n=1 Tax=Mucilaginibacter lacusdianchii TaxID=2684211 RepID=UPI00131C272B|nr:glycosyltransferase [Mucilaginibacter sp. JXJ CY 39]
MEAYIPHALFGLFIFCAVLQLYYLLFRQRYIAAYSVSATELPSAGISVSVIISARNEAENLKKFLPAILEQQYADFEVVVVNDCSVDESHHILRDFSKNYPHLKLVTVTEHPRFKTGKKFALTMGIKAAKHEHLLFTDADCQPASAHWLARMASNFSDNTEIILGYSPYIKTSGFLNAFIRFETLKTGINYLSEALRNNPYMGIGRNMSYTKSLFFRAKGFASHLHVLAGDDDLFVNKNATAGNTAIEIHPDAFTYSEAKADFKSYFKQKRRHMGVGGLYKNKHRRMLSTDALSGLLFYITLAMCLYFNHQLIVIAGVYLLRLITQIIIYQKAANKLGGKQLLWFLPFFDLTYYLYLIVFGLVGTFIKTTQWK